MKTEIPFYSIINFFITGVVFVFCVGVISNEYYLAIFDNELFIKFLNFPEILISIVFISLVYEIGFVLHRIGSVIFEELFKCLPFFPFNKDYSRFNQYKKRFPILSDLSREYAKSRTGVATFTILTFISGFTVDWKYCCFFLVINIVYFLSARKFSTKIVDLLKNKPCE